MKRILLGVVVLAVIAIAGLFAYALRHPAIAPVTPPVASDFAPDVVAKGETLAALGDCAVCHTAAGGEPYAGGLPLPTPFGTIHSTNITPDPETGIGTWSTEAFRRAMHQGVDQEGQYLYPAFPYDHFTRVTDDDVDAIYAFLMSQAPVKAEPKANEIGFPFNQRILLAGWNLLFLDDKRFQPDPSKDEKWNRGADLAEGLGHCGACHSPRNVLGAVQTTANLAGGEAEGWHAPALNADSPAPAPWTEDTLVNYFLDGWDGDHGIAAGPMTSVVNELATAPEEDAYALAAYLISFQDQNGVEDRTSAAKAFADEREFGGSATPATGPATPPADAALAAGQVTFARVCANCHKSGADMAPLGLSSTINGPDPRNLIHIIHDGIKPPEASASRSMPPFGGSLNEADMTNLVLFVRSHFSKNPAWTDVPARVTEIRAGEHN